ncbi:trans-aconitate methyltransferase [Bifidobacterium sp. DSM 109957]|uniref:Trans-aconitate methyltransferase n=2 Tax=Bifidobacterium oedipodis TaxID=2675322 RepID=A0A7Y0HQR0_9BIFI|nr:trans-aconitate methyltransferase [Bifidobacterium sp. DSM 109957]
MRIMTFTWDAAQYLKFSDQRTQPSRDLVNRLPADDGMPHKLLDIGCGPGNSTAQLASRYAKADALGIDTSAEMIATARHDYPNMTFQVLDAAELDTLPNDFDVAFTNACLQWVPNHREVIPAMLRRVKSGGVAACQFTQTIKQPAHTIMRELATTAPFSEYIGTAGTRPYHHLGGDHFDVSAYYDLIAPLSKHVEVWETTYIHALNGYDGVIEWYRGTGMRPYLAQLPDANLRREYEQAFVDRLRALYPLQVDGTVLIPMPRFFFLAQL